MKALSIRPPWAYYIVYGITYGISVDNGDGTTRVEDSGKVIIKDIENRDWPIPQWFKLPQRIYIHVSKTQDNFDDVVDFTVGKLKLPMFSILSSYSKLLPRGAIIGEVDIVECVTQSKSPWFVGDYGFVLKNPKPYDKPIPCKGKLGFFEPDSVSTTQRGVK